MFLISVRGFSDQRDSILIPRRQGTSPVRLWTAPSESGLAEPASLLDCRLTGLRFDNHNQLELELDGLLRRSKLKIARNIHFLKYYNFPQFECRGFWMGGRIVVLCYPGNDMQAVLPPHGPAGGQQWSVVGTQDTGP